MSYTRPDGDTVNFSFTGYAYARPTGNAVEFEFAEEPYYGRPARIFIKRGTRAQLDAAAVAGSLNLGEPYLITDESRMAVGLSATTYEAAAIEGEGGGAGSGDVVGPASSVTDHVALFDGTTGKLLKSAGAALSSKQDALVSATNIKTVNGTTLLGSGNVATDQITVSTTAPGSPVVNQLWLDIT